GSALATLLADKAREHWRATRFYRLLGRMLLRATEPSQRYRVLERFYRLPRPTIQRLYAGRSTPADRRRSLRGKPTGPVTRALAALLGEARSMEAAACRTRWPASGPASSARGLAGSHWRSGSSPRVSPPRWSRRATSRAGEPISGSATASPSTPGRPSSPIR